MEPYNTNSTSYEKPMDSTVHYPIQPYGEQPPHDSFSDRSMSPPPQPYSAAPQPYSAAPPSYAPSTYPAVNSVGGGGSSVNSTVVVQQSSTSNSNNDTETLALILLIVGFFFHILWLICFIMTRGNVSNTAKMYGNISCGLFSVGIVVAIIVIIIVIVVPIVVFSSAAAASSSSTYYNIKL
jgi:uncharacterized membrane protein